MGMVIMKEATRLSDKIINGNQKKYRLSWPTISSKQKHWFFGIGSLLGGVVLFGFGVWGTPVGRIRTIQIEGQYVLSRQEILNQLAVDWKKSTFQWDLTDLEKQIKSDSLIESVEVHRKGLNGLKIEIKEKPLMGCLEINQDYYYVLETGEAITNQEAGTCQGITFKGVETEEGLESLKMFVQFLDEMDPAITSLIKEVIYEPIYGDNNRFSLFLSDGNTVKVNTYTMMKKMAYYPMLLAQVHQVYGEVKGEFHLDVGDSFNPYRNDDSSAANTNEENDSKESDKTTETDD